MQMARRSCWRESAQDFAAPYDLSDHGCIADRHATQGGHTPFLNKPATSITTCSTRSELWRCADDAKELLTKIGAETSLRYAIHLITAASLVATRRKAATVEIEDVSKAYQLFIDVRRSTQFIIEYQARIAQQPERPKFSLLCNVRSPFA